MELITLFSEHKVNLNCNEGYKIFIDTLSKVTDINEEHKLTKLTAFYYALHYNFYVRDDNTGEDTEYTLSPKRHVEIITTILTYFPDINIKLYSGKSGSYDGTTPLHIFFEKVGWCSSDYAEWQKMDLELHYLNGFNWDLLRVLIKHDNTCITPEIINLLFMYPTFLKVIVFLYEEFPKTMYYDGKPLTKYSEHVKSLEQKGTHYLSILETITKIIKLAS